MRKKLSFNIFRLPCALCFIFPLKGCINISWFGIHKPTGFSSLLLSTLRYNICIKRMIDFHMYCRVRCTILSHLCMIWLAIKNIWFEISDLLWFDFDFILMLLALKMSNVPCYDWKRVPSSSHNGMGYIKIEFHTFEGKCKHACFKRMQTNWNVTIYHTKT